MLIVVDEPVVPLLAPVHIVTPIGAAALVRNDPAELIVAGLIVQLQRHHLAHSLLRLHLFRPTTLAALHLFVAPFADCLAHRLHLLVQLLRAEMRHVERDGEGDGLQYLRLLLDVVLPREAHHVHKEVLRESAQPTGLGELRLPPQDITAGVKRLVERLRQAGLERLDLATDVALQHGEGGAGHIARVVGDVAALERLLHGALEEARVLGRQRARQLLQHRTKGFLGIVLHHVALLAPLAERGVHGNQLRPKGERRDGLSRRVQREKELAQCAQKPVVFDRGCVRENRFLHLGHRPHHLDGRVHVARVADVVQTIRGRRGLAVPAPPVIRGHRLHLRDGRVSGPNHHQRLPCRNARCRERRVILGAGLEAHELLLGHRYTRQGSQLLLQLGDAVVKFYIHRVGLLAPLDFNLHHSSLATVIV
ncbi:ubiquitin carboxyl-terminal hydrolase 14 [Strigomonas culicis]|uniref:Ubiquitin carboxyl-terminal hydrolase 14 n=1 Tax=Strigomonas culicis TaxID=28005 RepID=S9URP5_9TRYP|nr:ubiquitin carboxyl-terminal hydrolase 14 [Strigomonas culicis]EPY29265.1 ubiquitin carboxyl-terminal hydrolase 14 [Strigomonas culicis]EPY31479.1 ubiquitin carboxyl-terminal hydrolase 14 [Strigomonas culicis]|eukprot:EPY25203.1 ubiquitin carboxyl-terminal hydrolase 14 [Strigomonas culicis]